ncbi:MAG: flagellar export chaperone FliS [Legionella sp. 40-6]|mgnify:FL=1|nr:flagellar export chaperone FliS [Legionella sp.]OJY28613.1 MAG: flagellar export chaperone FliS [Legionella sp. 40-6]
MTNPYQQFAEHYKDIELKTNIASADPHELINLLLQGARNHLAAAQGSMIRGQIAEKGEHLSKALNIIAGLKAAINQKDGGEIAANLYAIYSYIEPLIVRANLKNDDQLLLEANKLLNQIHDAWKEIAPTKVLSE